MSLSVGCLRVLTFSILVWLSGWGAWERGQGTRASQTVQTKEDGGAWRELESLRGMRLVGEGDI